MTGAAPGARVEPAATGVASGRVLVVGLPRSGTTWIAEALARADGAALVSEPDHPKTDPFGFRVSRSLGFLPAPRPDEPAAEYERLWEAAFVADPREPSRLSRARRRVVHRWFWSERRSTLRRSLDRTKRMPPRLWLASALASPTPVDAAATRPIVKSVTAAFALEWIEARWHPAMLLVLRNPLNVLPSWLELGIDPQHMEHNPRIEERFAELCGTSLPPVEPIGLRPLVWKVGALTAVLQAQAAAHPAWRSVTHEWLCDEPVERFRGLFADLGLPWTERARRFVAEGDRPGSGYDLARVAGEQRDRWRSRLTLDQVREAWSVLQRFPIDWSMFGGEPS